MDPRLLMDLAESVHRERLAWIEAHGWELEGMQTTRVSRRPQETLALALIALAMRLAPSAATLVQPPVPGIPRA